MLISAVQISINKTIFRQIPSLSLHLRMQSSMPNQNSSSRFKGKVAIITASTEGIGFAIAKRLGTEGADVVVSSRRVANVEKATEQLKQWGISVLGLTCHVSKEEDRINLIKKTVDTFGGVDILVSNAAVNPAVGGVLQCSGPAWDKIFEVNVKNSLQMSQLVVPEMSKRGGGSIVYVSSIAGYQPFDLLGAYSVSKTTLLGLTKAVAKEAASDGIRANCVSPGIIQTKFSKVLYENDDIREEVLRAVPLDRLGQPDDVAGVVAFLCSDDAAYVTGESVVVAGGMQSRL